MTSFATDLAAWRARLALTQDDAAAAFGIPLSTYRNYEQGRTAPQHEHLLRIAMDYFEERRRRNAERAARRARRAARAEVA